MRGRGPPTVAAGPGDLTAPHPGAAGPSHSLSSMDGGLGGKGESPVKLLCASHTGRRMEALARGHGWTCGQRCGSVAVSGIDAFREGGW